MAHPARRTLGRLIAALVVLVCHPFAARAQSTKPDPDSPTLSASFAYPSSLWPNRWTPLLVSITGGTKPFEGEVVVSYAQDDRIGAQIVRPVAATPGKTSVFPIMLNVPPACGQVNVSLTQGVGPAVARLAFNTLPDPRRGEAPLPPSAGMSPIVVALGNPSDALLGSTRSMIDPEPSSDQNRGAVGVFPASLSPLDPSLLPPTWTALDGVLLAVTTAETARVTDARARAGIREWVASGGRLVILVDGAGDAWRDWFADSTESPIPISIAPTRPFPVPTDLAKTLFWLPPKSDPATPRAGAPYPGAVTGGVKQRTIATPEAADLLEAAPSISARACTITPHGERLGWTLRFPLDNDPTAGLLAEGPLGFGWVCVVGFNPERVPAIASSDSTRRVWYSLLDNALADWRSRQLSDIAISSQWMNDSFQAGGFHVSDLDASSARNDALNRISDVPPLSSSLFPVFAIGIGVLALCIGPVDFFLLRALKARHRSWATALAWISLASVIAYYAPTFVRSSDTIVTRFSVLDASFVDAAQGSPAPAWRTGLTGVFAGATVPQRFTGDVAGSWWRPTSAQYEYTWGRQNTMTPRRSLRARQSLPDITALASPGTDPWGAFVPGRSGAGGTIPEPALLRSWTFHTYMDQARASTSIRARVVRDPALPAPSLRVELENIPSGAEVSAAVLRLDADGKDRWYPLSFQESAGTLAATPLTPTADRPPDAWDLKDPQQQQVVYYGGTAQTRARHMVPCVHLPGPDRRTQSVDRAVRHGHAALYFVLKNAPMDVSLDAQARQRHEQICRFIVPVSGPGTPSAKDTSK